MPKITKKRSKKSQEIQFQSYIAKLIRASPSTVSTLTTSSTAVDILNTQANYVLDRIVKAAEDVRTGLLDSKTLDVRVLKACLPLVAPKEVLHEANEAAERAVVRMMG